LEEMLAEVSVIDGCAAKAVDSNDHDIGLDHIGDPLAETEGLIANGEPRFGIRDGGMTHWRFARSTSAQQAYHSTSEQPAANLSNDAMDHAAISQKIKNAQS
jgi:hypothetical protein